MGEETNHKKISEEIKQKIRGINPKSEFSDISCFYSIIESLITGHSTEHISEFIKSAYKIDVEPSEIALYPSTYPMIEVLIKEYNISVLDEIDELQKMYIDVCQREQNLKEAMSDRGLDWTKLLKDIQGEKIKILETLNKAKNELRKFNIPSSKGKEERNDVWSPKFAAAISKLITTNMSKKDGKLRKFQPNKIEDQE